MLKNVHIGSGKMFICDECLDKHYKNYSIYNFYSLGTCEVCNQIRLCNDIYHGNLELKKKS